jgi:glycosyltransferase involved in cell wall biosynthesis
MKVGWLQDRDTYIGGQELSMEALRQTCPGEVIDVYPEDWRDVDVVIVGNCTQYSADNLVPCLAKQPVVKRVADWWKVGDPALRKWLLTYSHCLVFLSPYHFRQFPFRHSAPVTIIPPAVDPAPFIEAHGQQRRGTIWLGHMHDPDRKGVDLAIRWAVRKNEVVDFYGDGAPEYLTTHAYARVHPAVPYREVPALMAQYERFLFLPRHSEAFGRTVIEALYAGCEIVINAVPGCMWYLEADALDRVQSGSKDFWNTVQGVLNDSPEYRRIVSIAG